MKSWGRRVLLVLFWGSVGALLAGGISLILGAGEASVLPFVAGTIGASVIGPIAAVMGAKTVTGQSIAQLAKAKPGEPLPADAPRLIARIESLREAGVTVQNFRHLFEIEITVFPRTGQPHRETISQFITLGDLPNLATGAFVVAATTDAGTKIDLRPAPQWAESLRTAPELYGRITALAATHTPPADTREEVVLGAGRAMHPARRAVNLVLVAVCVAGGAYGSLLYVFNGADRLTVAVVETPQRWSGQVHGLWDSARLPLELADIQAQLGDRELQHIVVFSDFISLGVHSDTDPIGLDTYAVRNGRLDEPWASTRSDDGGFSAADIDTDLIREVTQRIYRETPDAEISDVQVRRSAGALELNVSITGKYQSTYRVFDAVTGEEIPQG
ncbi:hypothetical protein [Microbacterium sp. GXS0129]|uniref:hypothetical protein n=1 Tax=Microbacterium sp. GXS0129 TaxID=3377836 RepID=UPI00383A5414